MGNDDIPSMRTSRILPYVLAAVTVGGCASPNQAAPAAPPPASTTSSTATTTKAVANQVTTTACREYAENPDLLEIRRTVQSGATSGDTAKVHDALTFLFDLEVTAVRPGLDPEVATMMEQVSMMAELQISRLADTATLDPTAFERMAGHVERACVKAGVDMAPPT